MSTELVLICCRCDRGIRPGEKYDEHVHDRASAGPTVMYSHRVCPPK
jgi:hypothetical protein